MDDEQCDKEEFKRDDERNIIGKTVLHSFEDCHFLPSEENRQKPSRHNRKLSMNEMYKDLDSNRFSFMSGDSKNAVMTPPPQQMSVNSDERKK